MSRTPVRIGVVCPTPWADVGPLVWLTGLDLVEAAIGGAVVVVGHPPAAIPETHAVVGRYELLGCQPSPAPAVLRADVSHAAATLVSQGAAVSIQAACAFPEHVTLVQIPMPPPGKDIEPGVFELALSLDAIICVQDGRWDDVGRFLKAVPSVRHKLPVLFMLYGSERDGAIDSINTAMHPSALSGAIGKLDRDGGLGARWAVASGTARAILEGSTGLADTDSPVGRAIVSEWIASVRPRPALPESVEVAAVATGVGAEYAITLIANGSKELRAACDDLVAATELICPDSALMAHMVALAWEKHRETLGVPARRGAEYTAAGLRGMNTFARELQGLVVDFLVATLVPVCPAHTPAFTAIRNRVLVHTSALQLEDHRSVASLGTLCRDDPPAKLVEGTRIALDRALSRIRADICELPFGVTPELARDAMRALAPEHTTFTVPLTSRPVFPDAEVKKCTEGLCDIEDLPPCHWHRARGSGLDSWLTFRDGVYANDKLRAPTRTHPDASVAHLLGADIFVPPGVHFKVVESVKWLGVAPVGARRCAKIVAAWIRRVQARAAEDFMQSIEASDVPSALVSASRGRWGARDDGAFAAAVALANYVLHEGAEGELRRRAQGVRAAAHIRTVHASNDGRVAAPARRADFNTAAVAAVAILPGTDACVSVTVPGLSWALDM